MNKISVIIDYYFPSKKGGGPKKSVSLLRKILKKELVMDIYTYGFDVNGKSYDKNELEKNVNYISSPLGYFNFFNNRTIYFNSLFSKITIFSLLIILIFRKKNKVIISPRGEVFDFNISNSNSFLKILILRLVKVLFKNIIFHVTSEDEKKELIKYIGQNKTIKLIKNPIDTTIQKEIKKKYDFIFVGRVIKKKGLIKFIDQVAQINKKLKILLCVIVEDKKYWQICIDKIKNLKHKFYFKYDVDNKNVIHLFNLSKYSIVPSYNENHGHVIYEAIFSNCIPIVSENCGNNDIFRKYGLSINIHNEFNAVILKNINNTNENRKKLLRSLQDYFSIKFDIKNLKNKYLEMLS